MEVSGRELILETKQLCKDFGPTKAVNQVDLKIYRGQITGLIGENGSGKSTITSILAGMQSQTSGEMFYKGQPHKPASMIEAGKAGICMVVQEQGFVPGIEMENGGGRIVNRFDMLSVIQGYNNDASMDIVIDLLNNMSVEAINARRATQPE